MAGGAHAQAQEGCSVAARIIPLFRQQRQRFLAEGGGAVCLAVDKRQVAPGESEQPAQRLPIVRVARE